MFLNRLSDRTELDIPLPRKKHSLPREVYLGYGGGGAHMARVIDPEDRKPTKILTREIFQGCRTTKYVHSE